MNKRPPRTIEDIMGVESRQTEMKDYALLQQELEAAVIDTELKKCGEINFSIGWLKSFRDIFNSLLTEHESLLRQYQKLREAVCVLEDGAEPEVGDIFRDVAQLKYQCIGRPNEIMIEYTVYEGARRGCMGISLVDKIIQRNGKPVVYQSALKETV